MFVLLPVWEDNDEGHSLVNCISTHNKAGTTFFSSSTALLAMEALYAKESAVTTIITTISEANVYILFPTTISETVRWFAAVLA